MRTILIAYDVPDDSCDRCQFWEEQMSIMYTCPFRGWVDSQIGFKPTKPCREAEEEG